eukprot:1158954-Pelagomonas_calceolata.AAC.7
MQVPTTQTKRKSKHRSLLQQVGPHHGTYDTTVRQALSNKWGSSLKAGIDLLVCDLQGNQQGQGVYKFTWSSQQSKYTAELNCPAQITLGRGEEGAMICNDKNNGCVNNSTGRHLETRGIGTCLAPSRFKRSTDPLWPLPGCHQLGSALHMLSGCQYQIISSMKTERHNIAGRIMTKTLSKSPWGAGLVNTDIGNDDRLAQHNLSIPAHASNRIIPLYFFPHNFPKISRLKSSRPDAILITPYQAKTTSSSPSSSSSHYVLRSRHSPTQRTSIINRVRQPHQLNANQRHMQNRII